MEWQIAIQNMPHGMANLHSKHAPWNGKSPFKTCPMEWQTFHGACFERRFAIPWGMFFQPNVLKQCKIDNLYWG
jgi:hypothetical protein